MPRQVEGYAVLTDPDGPRKESKTYKCCNCGMIVFVNLNSDAGGFCMKCDDLICSKERCVARCWPEEKAILEMEGRIQLWQSFRQV